MDSPGRWDFSYANQTSLHPLGLAMLVLFGVMLLTVHRKYAVLPLLAMACFVSAEQRIAIGGLDFTLLRLLTLVGWGRLLIKGELRSLRLVALDWAMIAWTVVQLVTFVILWGTMSALTNRLGASFDAIGLYFLFRCLVRSWEDVRGVARATAMIAIPVAIAFLIEKATGRNLFSIFGGVPEITHVREGKLRCQGAFPHPILAGVFWAALVPLMGALWWSTPRDKRLAVAGVAAGTLVVYACSSSTPLAAWAAGFGAAGCWLIRHWLSYVRWGVVASLAVLHAAMEAPVWHLISRVDFVGGSSAWHRYFLIDRAIAHLPEWWLLGTKSTAHWGRGLIDVTNQFVREGAQGGVLRVALFVLVLWLGFAGVGRLWRAAGRDRTRAALAWGLGCVLWVQAVGFIGVSYFGQAIVVWYLPLAMIASLVELERRRAVRLTAARRAVRERRATAGRPEGEQPGEGRRDEERRDDTA